MLNKRLLLASSALAVLASIPSAHAAGGFYISVLGGANFLSRDDNNRTSTNFQSTIHHRGSDTGFLVGAEVGLHLDNWLRGLRVGVEADYRRNKLNGRWTESSTFSGPTGGPITGHQSTFSLLANVWYDIPLGSKFVPYIGGGAGWARTRVSGVAATTYTNGGDNDSGTGFVRDTSGFAYQLGAGVNYEIQDGVKIGVGYRYFHGPEIKNNVFLGKNDVLNFRNENHSVMFNLSIDVD